MTSGQATVGRYALHHEIAAGGMAVVHLGRLLGAAGFARTVAIKKLHAHLARDPEFVAMFLDEARLAARIRHPNVVSTLDVGSAAGELFVVMEYVPGESLAGLLRLSAEKGARIPIAIGVRIVIDVLKGLHAAHTATDELGAPLSIVHRDVSPQNVIVAPDGLARVLDFGVAKAMGQSHVTRDGLVRGKFRYMSPEQVSDGPVGPLSDVYSASVVLWEALTGDRLFSGTSDAAIVARVLEGVVPKPSKLAPGVPAELDAIVMRGLSRDADARFPSALSMAETLEDAGKPATALQVGRWVEKVAGAILGERREQIARMHAPAAGDAAARKAEPTVSFDATLIDEEPPRPSRPADEARAPASPRAPSRRRKTDGTLTDPGLAVAAAPPRQDSVAIPMQSRSRLYAVVGGAVLALATLGFFVSTYETKPRPPFLAPPSPTTTHAGATPNGPSGNGEPIPWLRAGNAVAAAAQASAAGLGPAALPGDDGASPSGDPGGRGFLLRPGRLRAKASPGAAPGAGAPPAAPAHCDPPTYTDTTGIRRVKPECL
jgi:serine/threonine-protein kinase